MSEETREIICDLERSDLFNCILNELEEDDIEKIMGDPTKQKSQTTLNCLGAGVITCLRNKFKKENKEGLKPQIKFSARRNPEGFWRMKDIQVILEKQIDDDFYINSIKQCFKYIEKSCQIGEKINIDLKPQSIEQELDQFTVNLMEMKDWLSQVRKDKQNTRTLFKTFNEIATKKVQKDKKKN